ncbi:MAG: NAD(P)-dependent oxidoreductase [Anaerolineae bacterium]|jgi:phosphoglycerate dehydrogenase-like enzyme
MSPHVHLLRDPGPAPLEHLRVSLHSDIDLTLGSDPSQQAEYEILVAGRPRREHITASRNLRALIIPWAGVPPETRELMLAYPDISVHNLHHNAVAAAETAVALMLAAAKFIIPIDRALRRHDWTARYRSDPAVLVEGKTLLILGYGAVGGHVAQICRGLSMRVLATRRHTSNSDPEGIHSPEALPSLLPQADVLIVALPLTAETNGLIGQQELELLPPKAVLVNVGRGPIVEEEPLYRALRDGTLYAAGLDVWYNYPEKQAGRPRTPPSAWPFHELENVVMSPHRAGAVGSDEIELRCMDHLARLLNARARGEKMPNLVDLEAGY